MTESSESEILATACQMNLQQEANAKAAMAYNVTSTIGSAPFGIALACGP